MTTYSDSMMSYLECQYCGKQATVVGVFIKEVEYKQEPMYLHCNPPPTSNLYDMPIHTRLRIMAKTELVGMCDDHDHLGFTQSNYFLKCRLTSETKKELEKAIRINQESVENNRSVRIE